jgi:ABC-type nitrate/sulfonate/bicarbonate transport system substrate-binding protein
VRSIADLKHKTVNMPFGSIAYLLGSIEMQKTGFDLKKDVTLQHIDILEQTNIIQKGTSKSWGEAAAFIGWDPTIAQLEEQGKARVLMVLPDTGVVVMSKKFYEAHPEAAKNFLKSLVQAYDFYYKNKQTADDWYLADAGVNFSQRVMEAAGSLERNNNAEGIKNISLLMEDGDIAKMQTEIDQAFSLGIKKKQTSASDINERSFVKDAEKEIDEGNFSKEVRVDLTYDEK